MVVFQHTFLTFLAVLGAVRLQQLAEFAETLLRRLPVTYSLMVEFSADWELAEVAWVVMRGKEEDQSYCFEQHEGVTRT
jgi:hypothetical protein